MGKSKRLKYPNAKSLTDLWDKYITNHSSRNLMREETATFSKTSKAHFRILGLSNKSVLYITNRNMEHIRTSHLDMNTEEVCKNLLNIYRGCTGLYKNTKIG